MHLVESDADLDAACLTRTIILAEIERAKPGEAAALLADLADLDRQIADAVMVHFMHPQPEPAGIAILPAHARRAVR